MSDAFPFPGLRPAVDGVPVFPGHRGRPRSGDVLHVTRAAGVQFSEPMLFRVIRVHDWSTYEGHLWLDGYELNANGDAYERRSIWVVVAGLRWVDAEAARRTAWRRPATSNGAAGSYGPPRQRVRQRTG